MKKLILISGTIILFYAGANDFGSCDANAKIKTMVFNDMPGDSTQTKTVKLKITGMTCGGCANHIHNALSKKQGVISDDVSYPGDVATIKYDPDKITEEEIIKAIKKTGFKAEVLKEN